MTKGKPRLKFQSLRLETERSIISNGVNQKEMEVGENGKGTEV